MSKNKNKNFDVVMKLAFKHNKNSWKWINEELITLHYEIGEYLSKKIEKGECNDNDIEVLANQIFIKYPGLVAMNNKDGLYKIIKFYETYKKDKYFVSLAKETTWENNLTILDLDASMNEKEYYLMMCSEHELDHAELDKLIKGNSYQKFISDLEKLKKEIKNEFTSWKRN